MGNAKVNQVKALKSVGCYFNFNVSKLTERLGYCLISLSRTLLRKADMLTSKLTIAQTVIN